jgi:hypothetical protein
MLQVGTHYSYATTKKRHSSGERLTTQSPAMFVVVTERPHQAVLWREEEYDAQLIRLLPNIINYFSNIISSL